MTISLHVFNTLSCDMSHLSAAPSASRRLHLPLTMKYKSFSVTKKFIGNTKTEGVSHKGAMASEKMCLLISSKASKLSTRTMASLCRLYIGRASSAGLLTAAEAQHRQEDLQLLE